MWVDVALLGFNALSQTLNRDREQLAWTEGSESHSEADTCIFNFPCGRTKNMMESAFTGMQGEHETPCS